MRITKELIDRCNKNELGIEELLLMYNYYFNTNWELNVFPAKILKLKTLGLVDDNDKLTYQGETVLFDIISGTTEPTNPPTEKIEEFEKFWKAFPVDDGWSRFPSTRILRNKKVLTKTYYVEALKEITHDKLLSALTKEVEFRKNSAYENKLKYMKSSYNWLKDKCYLDMIESDEDYEENRAEVL